MDVSPLTIILVGLLFVVLGVVFPLLMMLGVIPTTFVISFLSFALSVGGVLMGVVGASRYVARRRR